MSEAQEVNVEANFSQWWYSEGSRKYADMIDSDVSMRRIIEMIFDAGQMAALNDAKKVMANKRI